MQGAAELLCSNCKEQKHTWQCVWLLSASSRDWDPCIAYLLLHLEGICCPAQDRDARPSLCEDRYPAKTRSQGYTCYVMCYLGASTCMAGMPNICGAAMCPPHNCLCPEHLLLPCLTCHPAQHWLQQPGQISWFYAPHHVRACWCACTAHQNNQVGVRWVSCTDN